ncbi:MAG: glycosyltransferase family 9 protein [Gemmatimonadetes bacterium]|nr:glycosyltransferase family 9 protein [Gemmatimonadota bacterium]
MLPDARVAIVLLSAIGDVVHAFPLAASLRAALPRGRIEWIVQPVPSALVEPHPAVDRTWILDRRRGWRAFRDFRRAVKGERFDLVVDLQIYGKASLATAILDAPRKLGFDRARARELNWLSTNERIPARPGDHVLEQYLEFADHLRVPRRYEWAFPLSPAEREARRAFLDRRSAPVAAIVAATSREWKDWPAERWAKVAGTLHGEWGYEVCLVGGPHPRESARAAAIERLAACPVSDERGADLRRLLWLLDAAAIVLAPDTGPYHVAVGLGVPSVGVFGATDPARHGPGRRFPELVVDGYHDPGEGWRPPRREWRKERMRAIEAGPVLEAVELARGRYRRAVEGPTSVEETG